MRIPGVKSSRATLRTPAFHTGATVMDVNCLTGFTRQASQQGMWTADLTILCASIQTV